jgi:hypothetical protein
MFPYDYDDSKTIIIETPEDAYGRRRLKIAGTNWYAHIQCKTIFRNVILVGDGANYSNSMNANAGYFTSLVVDKKTIFENVDCYTLPIVCQKPGAIIKGVNSRFGMIRYGTTGWNHGASTSINGNVIIELKNCSVNRLNCSACGYTDGDSSGNFGEGTINGSLTIFADNSSIKMLTSPGYTGNPLIGSKYTYITDGLYLYSLNGSTFPDNDFVVTNGTHNRTLELYGGWAEINPNSNSSIFLYSEHPRRIPTVINEIGEESKCVEDSPWEWEISDGITVVDFNKTTTKPYTKTEELTFDFNSHYLSGIPSSRMVSPYEQIILPEYNDFQLPTTLEELHLTLETDEPNAYISFDNNFPKLKYLDLRNSRGFDYVSGLCWDSLLILELTGVDMRKSIIEGLPPVDTPKTIYIKGVTQEEITAINVPEGWVIEDNEFTGF